MTAVNERIARTTDGRHVLDDHEDAAYLAYPPGSDVPDEVLAELAGQVTPAPEPEPDLIVEPEPPTPPTGSRLRVFTTTEGRHVLEGHPDAAFLAYHEDEDVPADILLELAEDDDPDTKAAKPAPNKARRPAANKAD